MFWSRATILFMCAATGGCSGRPLLDSRLSNRPEASMRVDAQYRPYSFAASPDAQSGGHQTAVSPVTLSNILRPRGAHSAPAEPVTGDTIILDDHDREVRAKKQDDDYRRWDSIADKAMTGICVGCGPGR